MEQQLWAERDIDGYLRIYSADPDTLHEVVEKLDAAARSPQGATQE